MATKALEAQETVVLDVKDPVEAWRFAGFLKLDFTVGQAEHMAITRADDGTYLYPGDAERMLDEGLPHWLVYDLLT